MAGIKFEGSSGLGGNYKEQAFPSSKLNGTINWDKDVDLKNYKAYLVRVTGKDVLNNGDEIEFQGIDLKNPQDEKQPKFRVKLRQSRYVWSAAPSTNFDNWAQTTADCGVLLLSDAYVKGHAEEHADADAQTVPAQLPKPELEASAAADPNKWPKGSLGIFERAQLQERLLATEAAFSTLKGKLMAFSQQLEGTEKEAFERVFADSLSSKRS
jgi:hypothetical protein